MLLDVTFSSSVLLIAAIAIFYAVGAVVLQRRLTNPKRQRELQRKIKEHTNTVKEMTKSGAQKSEIMSKQNEMMPLLSESMRSQIKPMFVILPLFLILYYVLLPYLISSLGATKSTVDFIFSGLSYQSFFFVVVFISGIATSIFVLVYDKAKGKKEAQEAAEAKANL